jgi:hypothetical protein
LQYPVDAIVSVMALYRNPGSFTLADGTELDVGQAPVPATSPGGGSELGRVIPVSDQVFSVFVPAGGTTSWSVLRERWETQLRLTRPDSTALATFAPVFRVDDPARYYDSSAGTLARSIDLCYSGLDGGGNLVTDPTFASIIVRQVRNETKCSAVAPSGPATGVGQRVAFDDPRSPFRGCTRTVFFGTEAVFNTGGATIWYTTPFGGQASPVRFANSVVQRVAPASTGSIVLAQVQAGQQSACPAASVHVPN